MSRFTCCRNWHSVKLDRVESSRYAAIMMSSCDRLGLDTELVSTARLRFVSLGDFSRKPFDRMSRSGRMACRCRPRNSRDRCNATPRRRHRSRCRHRPARLFHNSSTFPSSSNRRPQSSILRLPQSSGSACRVRRWSAITLVILVSTIAAAPLAPPLRKAVPESANSRR